MESYTIRDISMILGVDRTTIFRYIKEGKIRAKKQKKGKREIYIFNDIPDIPAKAKTKAKKNIEDNSSYSQGDQEDIWQEIKQIKENQVRIIDSLERIESYFSQNSTALITTNQQKPEPVVKAAPQEPKFDNQQAEELRIKLHQKVKKYGSVKHLAMKMEMSRSTLTRFLKALGKTKPENLEYIKSIVDDL